MENLPGNLGIAAKTSAIESRPFKKARQWTILLVDDHGEVISFSRFKEAVIISASMLFVAVIATIILFFLYKNTQNDNKKLKNTLTASQKKASSLRNENDILMARLAISESKVNTDSDKKQADEEPASVGVNDLNVYYDKDKKKMEVQYIIKKTSLNTKIAGRTLAILKNNEVNQNKWLILPSDKLIKGKPSGKVGQSFLFSNFIKITFKVTHQINPNRFKKATVFVFSKKGELLLEKDFPVLIKSLS